MMNDIEKQRADYVTQLELMVQHLQRQVAELQAEAKWVPKFGSELSSGEARLTLAFGGKNQTAQFSTDFLDKHSVIDATTNIIKLGFEEMIHDRFREVVQPEVERLKRATNTISEAGKW